MRSQILPHEIVEDSEPEREKLRRERRLQRKKTREIEVFELSDAEFERRTRIKKKGSIIDISDDSISDSHDPPSSSCVASNSIKALSSQASENEPNGESQAIFMQQLQGADDATDISSPSIEHIAPRIVQKAARAKPVEKKVYELSIFNHSSIFDDTMDEEDDQPPTLGIERFAFKPATRPAPPKSIPHTFSTTAETVPTKPTKKDIPAVPAHRFTNDFSDMQLAGLTKCIGCETKWTARKTATQKMLHVQTCAKKKTFSDETIRVLIRQQLDAHPLSEPFSRTNGRSKSARKISTAVDTMFDKVVQDAAPKRKGKRPEVAETVRLLPDTREDILVKARKIIGQVNSLRSLHGQNDREDCEETVPPSMQAFARSTLRQRNTGKLPLFDLPDSEMPPSTQAFQPSRLAQKLPPKNSLFAEYSSGDDDDTDMPPSTYFQSSKLGQKPLPGTAPSPVLFRSDIPTNKKARNPSFKSILVIDDSSSASEHFQMHRSSKAIEVLHTSRGRTPSKMPNSLPRDYLTGSDIYDDEMNFDDAYLYFDPDVHIDTPLDNIEHNERPTKKSRKERKAPNTDSEGLASENKGKPKSPTKRRGKGKEKVHDVEEIYDEHWERTLKNKILRDIALHRRILRYEPIHFSVFVGLATEDATRITGNLLLHLRLFLDKQAINFHGAEPRSRNRR